MAAPSNPNRLPDIQDALKRVKPSDMLSLEALAIIWGVAKSRFVTVKNKMPNFPPPIPEGTSHIFVAKAALKAMLAYETRHHHAAAKQARLQDAILGNLRERRVETVAGSGMEPRQLQILQRMAAEVEQREREQRLYIPAAEVSATAGDVFSELSEFMAGLSNKIDPNGLLDPGLRVLIDDGASTALLGFHKRLKVLLNADADPSPPGRATSRARKPRTRR